MHKKEMKTTYCPSAGITRIRFLGYDLSLCK